MKKKSGLEALNAIVDVVLAYKKATPKKRRKRKRRAVKRKREKR